MIFHREHWQKLARKMLRPSGYSYAKLAVILACSKSKLWQMLNSKTATISIEDMLLISRQLSINPLDFIVKDEVQLQLL